jgi:hypothetical protein
MTRRLLISALAVVILMSIAGRAIAAPVTWFATGTTHITLDQAGALSGLAEGTPWQLQFTFDPLASGTVNPGCAQPIYFYDNAITSTTLQVGGLVYTNATGDIYTNWDLPIGGCPTPSGRVQFQWLGGWSGGTGGPNLNAGSALMLASYIDLLALDGSLPGSPTPGSPNALNGLQWTTLQAPTSQFVSSFDPQLAPTAVPEPGTLVLLASGGLMAARRLRRK